MKIMLRLRTAGLVVAALAFVACGSSDPTPTSTATATSAPATATTVATSAVPTATSPAPDPTATQPAATPTPSTRTVTDAYGEEIVIPANPQRIIVTDNEALPYVLELGVIPLAAGSLGPGTYDGLDFHPALYDLGAEDVTSFSRDEPDYELVASLNPDLIIGATFSLENRVQGGTETYSSMAPVVAIDSNLSMFEQLRAYGRVLGKEAEAEQLISNFEESMQTLAADISVETVSVARAFGDSQVFIYTSAEPFTSLWVDLLGVTVVPGPEVANPETGTLIVSGERIGELSGEALVVVFGIERLETNPLWPLLPAVEAGNVHHAGDYLVYTGQGGLSALQEQLTGIAEFLAGIES